MLKAVGIRLEDSLDRLLPGCWKRTSDEHVFRRDESSEDEQEKFEVAPRTG